MMHPDTEVRLVNEEIGLGVFAIRFIPKGTITWTHDPLEMIINTKDVANLDPLYKSTLDTYGYLYKKHLYLMHWDQARYINHSFKANTLYTPYRFDIAIQDIEAGEEITNDYGQYDKPDKPYFVHDEGVERKQITRDDILLYHKEWDKQLAEVFPLIASTKQPLMPVIDANIQETIEAILAGKKALDSILTTYFPK